MAIKNCYMQKIADKKEFWLAGGAILLALVGCSIFTPDAATATPAPVPGVNELHFKDAVTGQRFRSLDGTIQGLADKTWWTTSYQLHGNFYESRRTRPQDPLW